MNTQLHNGGYQEELKRLRQEEIIARQKLNKSSIVGYVMGSTKLKIKYLYRRYAAKYNLHNNQVVTAHE